ncbi:MAG: tonR1 [Puniceicoccaceae bacterium 5H]|nr:MAG: tonR1 [Puniceicoccaceae bacterium 5H]
MKSIAGLLSLIAVAHVPFAGALYASVCDTPVYVPPEYERLGKALREIEAQTHYHFSYVEEEIDLDAPIELPAHAATVADVLEALAEFGQLQFKRIGNQIAIRPGAPEVIDPECYHPDQAAAPEPPKLRLRAPSVIELAPFPVNSFAYANAVSMQRKHQALGLMETISADEIGQLPDLNVADALKRVPGVMSILDEDESRYVSIRAVQPDYLNATIDGIPIAAQDYSRRRVNLEAIPTNAVLRLEVTKSVQPDQTDASISGNVNLVTRSPFDTDLPQLSILGMGGYFDSQAVPGNTGLSWRTEMTVTERFGPRDMFGLLYGFTYYQKVRDEEKTNQNSYRWYNDGGFRVENPDQGNGYPVTHHYDWFVYNNTVTRRGHLLKLESRPHPNFEAKLTGYYFSQFDDEDRFVHHLYNRGTVSEQTPTTGRIAEGEAVVQFTDYPIFRANYGTSLHARYTTPFDLEIRTAVGYSAAEENFTDNDTARFSTPSTTQLAYRYDMSHQIARYELEHPDYFLEPANYQLDTFESLQRDSDEDIYTGQLKLSYHMEPQHRGWGFYLGVTREKTHRDYAYDRDLYYTTSSNPVTVADAYDPTYYVPPNRDEPFIFLDFAAFQQLFAAEPERFQYIAGTSAIDSLLNDFVYEEDLDTGIAMARYGLGRASFLLSAQYEGNTTEVFNFKRSNSRFEQVVTRNDYSRVLPAASLRYEISPHFIMRAAVSQAVGHPQIEDLVVQQIEQTSSSSVTISRGNPELEPSEAVNADLAFEYYFDRPNAMVSVGFFQKQIDGEIYITTRSFTENGIDYTITEPVNGESTHLYGLELSYVQNRLTFLPGPLAHLGVSANATFLHGQMTVNMNDGSERILDHALEQPDYFWNGSLFYGLGRWEAQLGYTYTGKYRAYVDRDQYWHDYSWDAFDQLDLQLRYEISSHLELRAEVRNVTNSKKVRLRGPNQELLHEIVAFGRSFWIGANYYY